MPELIPLALFLGMLIVSFVAMSSLGSRPSVVHLPLSLVVMFPVFLAVTDEPGAVRADLVILIPLIGLALVSYVIRIIRLRRLKDESRLIQQARDRIDERGKR